MEKSEILEKIEISFSGSMATSDLVKHFSGVSTPDECMSNFIAFCRENDSWYTKNEITVASPATVKSGKAFKAPTSGRMAGYKIVARQAARAILAGSWSDTLAVAAITREVKTAINDCQNDKAVATYKAAIVYNNMSAFMSGQKEIAGSNSDNESDTKSLLDVITELLSNIQLADISKLKKDELVTEYKTLVTALQAAIE